MASKATRFADKFSLGLPIGLLAMPASATRARRIARIDQPERDTRQSSLVGHKGTELAEGPPAHPGSLALAKPCTVADARQLFESNPASGVFGQTNKPLADHVIGVAAKSRFSPFRASECSPDVFRAFAASLPARRGFLQDLSSPVVALACALDSFTREGLPVAGRRQIHNAQIDAQKVLERNMSERDLFLSMRCRVEKRRNRYINNPFNIYKLYIY